MTLKEHENLTDFVVTYLHIKRKHAIKKVFFILFLFNLDSVEIKTGRVKMSLLSYRLHLFHVILKYVQLNLKHVQFNLKNVQLYLKYVQLNLKYIQINLKYIQFNLKQIQVYLNTPSLI